jgi:hypothetical protein
MATDLRQQILDTDDIVYEEVEVAEWKGAKVWVRSMTGQERDWFEECTLVKKGKKREASLKDVRARLVAATVCSGNGNPEPLFTPNDVAKLTKKSAKALDRIYEVAARLSGISDEDVEELVGNSGTAPSGGSGSSLVIATVER